MITKTELMEYRKAADKIGVWDRDYVSIKKDLSDSIQNIRDRDYAMDIVGASIGQFVLYARLIVYGNIQTDLSEDDLEVMLLPSESLSDLKNTPYLLGSGVENFAKGMLPLLFSTMEESRDYEEFESSMRSVLVKPANLPSFSLSFGIAVGICFRKYKGLEKHFDELNSRLRNMLKSEKLRDIFITIDKADPNTLYGKSFMMSSMLSTAIIECNTGGSVTYEQMYDVIKTIHEMASENSDLYTFINSKEFKLFMRGVGKYHDIK